MDFFAWFRKKKAVESPSREDVLVNLKKVQAGTLRFAAKKLEYRAGIVENHIVAEAFLEEAHDLRGIADSLSPRADANV